MNRLNRICVIQIVSLLAVGCSNGFRATQSISDQRSSESTIDPGPGQPSPIPSSTTIPVANPARKSPSPGQWVNIASNLAGSANPGDCGNIGNLYQKPNEDLMLATVATRGVWGSRDGGKSWQEMGKGAGSIAITNRGTSFIFDPAHPNTFWQSGMYGQGVVRTDDDGNTFKWLGGLSHIDWVSVDFTDPNRKTLLAGGHEQSQTRGNAGLYLSKDGGNNWLNIGGNLPAGTAFESHPFVVNATTFFLGLYQSWGGGSAGIYQTNDSGNTWTLKTSDSFSAGPALAAKDGSIYFSGQDGSVVRATGSGANWTFKQTAPSGTLKTIDPVSLVELPDGRLAGLANNGIKISPDHGTTWNMIGPQTPFGPEGFTYSSADNSFYVWHSVCNDSTSADPIWKYWLP